MTSVEIPEGVTTIEESSFSDCSGLTTIVIPKTVNTIRNYAFNNCPLVSVTVNNPIPVAIGHYTFSNRANATLFVPAGCVPSYQAANLWKEFKNIVEIGDPNDMKVVVSDEDMKKDIPIYDINGMRLKSLKKGINIINGRKIMAK